MSFGLRGERAGPIDPQESDSNGRYQDGGGNGLHHAGTDYSSHNEVKDSGHGQIIGGGLLRPEQEEDAAHHGGSIGHSPSRAHQGEGDGVMDADLFQRDPEPAGHHAD